MQEESNNFVSSGIAQKALLYRQKTDLTELFSNLNPEQKKAVETTQGATLILAGAGTGKTRVLTTRIALILKMSLALPQQILAVTFTNKAAEEMKKRIFSLTQTSVESMPWIGTFHSICLKILRRHAEYVGLKSNFSVLDSDDQIRLVRKIIQEHGLDEKRWSARSFVKILNSWKNESLKPEDILAKKITNSFGNGKAYPLYQAYQERLQSLNACDFGDLLLHPTSIFRQNHPILEQYQQKFRYILVDEYQDTNVTQYMLLRLLTQRSDPKERDNVNICCVGDDDQAIYGWRGAKVSNILRFEKDFPSACIIRLEQNYRSTSHILAAASHLIACNSQRISKTLRTDRDCSEDPPVWVHAAYDSEEEAYAICKKVVSYHSLGCPLNDIAILVRASFQMREFEDRFVTEGISYRVIGGPRFYERLEIRDALAYLRIVAQTADDLAFERIINVPKRGLGDVTLRCLYQKARENRQSLFQTALKLIESDFLGSASRKSLTNLISHFQRWQASLQTMHHAKLAEMILHESGYIAMWQKDPSLKAEERIENLKELIRSMEEYESLRSFLDHVSLVMDSAENNQRDALSVMTLHSAKGLEFETVFLPGWEEELFPHPRALNENGPEGLEEERRLAYVGLTRAKKNLHIWFSASRRIHGSWQSAQPSRFLEELPEKNISIAGHKTLSLKEQQSSFSTQTNRNQKIFDQKASLFSLGDRVFHLKFGNGNVIDQEGEKLTVHFDRAGYKKILNRFVTKI